MLLVLKALKIPVYSGKNGLHLAKNEALLLSWISKVIKSNNWIEYIGGVAGIIGLLILYVFYF